MNRGFLLSSSKSVDKQKTKKDKSSKETSAKSRKDGSINKTSEKDHSMMSISLIPEEIMEHIFSFLDPQSVKTVSTVSR